MELWISNLWLPPKDKHDRSSPPPVIQLVEPKKVDQSDHIHPTPLLIRLNFHLTTETTFLRLSPVTSSITSRGSRR